MSGNLWTRVLWAYHTQWDEISAHSIERDIESRDFGNLKKPK